MLTSEEIRGFMLEDRIADGIHVKGESSATPKKKLEASRDDAPEAFEIHQSGIDIFGELMLSQAAFGTSAVLQMMRMVTETAFVPALLPSHSDIKQPDCALPNAPALQLLELSNEIARESFLIFTKAFTGMFLGVKR